MQENMIILLLKGTCGPSIKGWVYQEGRKRGQFVKEEGCKVNLSIKRKWSRYGNERGYEVSLVERGCMAILVKKREHAIDLPIKRMDNWLSIERDTLSLWLRRDKCLGISLVWASHQFGHLTSLVIPSLFLSI